MREVVSRDQTLPLCLSWKDCVEGDEKEAQACADRTQATVAQKRMAPTRFHVASEHMAGTSQVQARWHRNTGLRLSGGNLSGQDCNRGCHSRARTGGCTVVPRVVRVACNCNAGTWSSWRGGDETDDEAERSATTAPSDVGPGWALAWSRV